GGHGGVWECPDLFPLPVEGQETERWVLIQSLNPGAINGGSGTQYFIGDFVDGVFSVDETFTSFINHPSTNESQESTVEKEKTGRAVWLDHGRDNYAGVTWSDIPSTDGRRLFMGWMSNWDYAQVVPTEQWRSAMTLPRTLTLRPSPEGIRLFAQPIAALQTLRQKRHDLSPGTFSNEQDFSFLKLSGGLYELILEFDFNKELNTDFGIELSNTIGETYQIGYDTKRNQFYSDRRHSGKKDFSEAFANQVITAPRLMDQSVLKMHLFLDRSSVELFADEGANCMTELFFPNEDFQTIKLYVKQGKTQLKSGVIYELQVAQIQ
ncbi:MAG: glycoside hydrolase family 32 protein, partial [Bacteroidota bacterium]